MNNLLTFATPTIFVSVPLENVVRILPLAMLQEIPEAPPWFLGLLDLEGVTLPVIDLALRLGMAESPPYQLSTPIVVLTWKGQQIGLIVQEVLGVSQVMDGHLTHTELFQDNDGPPFLGIARTTNTGLTLVLNPARMMDTPLHWTASDWLWPQELPQLQSVLHGQECLESHV